MICNRRIVGMLLSLLLISVIGIGCETTQRRTQTYTPPPTRRGIPDPIMLDQLDEMISEMTQYLAVALPNQQEVRDSEYQYVLAIRSFSVAGFSDPGRFHVALEEIQTRTGPQERRFGLEQAIPLGGKRANRRAVARHGATR